MATVKVEQNTAGDYAIGIDVDGTFIAFASVPAHRIAHQIERRETLQQRADEGDKVAQDALTNDFAAPNASWTDETKPKGGK